MVLILIGEFADNIPGDDIKLVTHNSKIIDDDALYKIIVPTYMGLFSSGGNKNEEKYGTIPLEQNRSAFAWSCSTIQSQKSRLLVAVVPTNELSGTISLINTKEVQERIKQIKSILMTEELDIDVLNRAIAMLDSNLQGQDEVNRLSNVFGNEI